MADDQTYSFDTSAIINGQHDLFPCETFPSLWGAIESMIADGRIRSVDEVERELRKKDDDAHQWVRAQSQLFVPLDEAVQVATATILTEYPRLVGKGKNRNGADPFVIALAMVTGSTVVTEERKTGNLNKPHIPDICEALGVPCVNLVGFVQLEGWTF